MRKYIMVVHVPNRPDLTGCGAMNAAEKIVRGRLGAMSSVKTVNQYVDEDGICLPSFLEITSEDDIFDALKVVGETFFEVTNPAKA